MKTSRLFSLLQNHLLTAFIPWIFFSVVYGPSDKSKMFACLGALVLILIFNFKELKKGFVLPWGSAIFFGLFALNAYFEIWPWAEEHGFLLINSALAAIVIISMLIGKPFTLQYAREEVDPSRWHHPLFIKINWILTSIWAVLMIIMALPSFFLTQEQILQSWFWNWGLTVICIVVGLQCNKIIPKLMTQKNKHD